MAPREFKVKIGNETDAYLISVVLSAWRALVLVMAIGNIVAGLLLTLGPSRFRAAPNYNFFEYLSLPDQTWPVILAVSGVMLLASWFIRSLVVSVGAHSVAFVALMWWGIVAFGYLIDGRSITGAGVVYILELAILHMVAIISRIRVWYLTKEN